MLKFEAFQPPYAVKHGTSEHTWARFQERKMAREGRELERATHGHSALPVGQKYAISGGGKE